MNVTSVHFKVLEKYLEIGVVVEQGFALGVDDMNGEDAVIIVGLHEAAVVAKECELLVDLELMTDYRFEMGHGVSPVIGQSGKREPGRGSRTGTELAKRQGVGATLRQRLPMSPDGHDIEQNVEHVQGRGFGHVARESKEEDEARDEDVGHDLISNWVPYRTRLRNGTRLIWAVTNCYKSFPPCWRNFCLFFRQ